MKLEVASLSDVGKLRQNNEDAVGCCEPEDDGVRKGRGLLFVVADGMGGHRGGETASRLAIDTILKTYYDSEEEDPMGMLRESFDRANSVIHEQSMNDAALFGMGTTCTAMAVRGGASYFAHVGDSRAYVLRKGRLRQLTEDHSLVGEMVRSGILSDEDAQNHPKRNVITRSLGTQEELATDFPASPYPLADGDVFLLCSDGLTSMVSDEEICEALRSAAPKKACRTLVGLANDHGGKDNITVQIVKVKRASGA